MKTLLVIAYYYPPLGGAGVQRTTKFIKYIRKLGWRVIVLTTSDQYYHVVDNSLAEVESESLLVFRTPPLRKYNVFLRLLRKIPLGWRLADWLKGHMEFPDNRAHWIKPAVSLGKQLVKNYQVDAVYSTSSPYSTHMVAKALAACCSTPWVADFRDPWIDIPELQYKYQYLNKKAAKEEHKVAKLADAVILNTEETLSCFIAKYPEFSNKFCSIPNGYDESDFVGREEVLNERYTITYTGSLYGKRSVGNLFKAINIIANRHPSFIEDAKICFYGNVKNALAEAELNDDLKNIISITPYIEHEHVIAKLLQSHLLLLFTHTDIVGELCIPGKLYEYVRAARPVLAFGVGSGIKRVLDESKSGHMVAHDDIEQIVKEIEQSYLAYKANNQSYFLLNNRALVQKYSRESLASELDVLLTSKVLKVKEGI
ncbi:glycosyltransferase [Thalassotalea montiporae]